MKKMVWMITFNKVDTCCNSFLSNITCFSFANSPFMHIKLKKTIQITNFIGIITARVFLKRSSFHLCFQKTVEYFKKDLVRLVLFWFFTLRLPPKTSWFTKNRIRYFRGYCLSRSNPHHHLENTLCGVWQSGIFQIWDRNKRSNLGGEVLVHTCIWVFIIIQSAFPSVFIFKWSYYLNFHSLFYR